MLIFLNKLIFVINHEKLTFLKNWINYAIIKYIKNDATFSKHFLIDISYSFENIQSKPNRPFELVEIVSTPKCVSYFELLYIYMAH